MQFFIILIILLALSVILAWRSLKDFDTPHELKPLIKAAGKRRQQLWGVIVFAGSKIWHYSSTSSSPSSDSSETANTPPGTKE